MTLFDDKERYACTEEVQSGRSKFAFVNDYQGWEDTSDIRRKCESWFENIPHAHAEERKDLRSRFRSHDDLQHAGAFFELLLHEMFIRLGCHMEKHPGVSGLTPDFRVTQDQKSIYVEATAVGERSNPFYRSRNEQGVIDTLNRLSSPDFFIGVDMQGTLKETVRRDYVTSKFEKLLTGHDPDEVRRVIEEFGLYAAPFEKIELGNWTLTGWLLPVDEDRRSEIGEGRIIMEPYMAKSVDPIASVRDALSEKAKKYNTLDGPLVVAVNALNPFYFPPDSDLDVLFGRQGILFGEGPDGRTQFGRDPKGFWSSESSSGTAAVLRFKHADMLNMFQTSACLYINPQDSSPPLPDALFRLPISVVSEGTIIPIEGEDVAQLLEVNWK